jgi:hypothetical protein
MKLRFLPPATAALLATLLFTGCATFDDSELGIIRGSGVSQRVYTKMEDGRELTPEDVIELTRRGVPDRFILRQIDEEGVDYVLTPEDEKRLEKARVSPPVMDALRRASDDFSSRYAAPRHSVYIDEPAVPYHYDDGYYGADPYPIHGSIGIGISSPRHRHWHRR